MSTKEITITCSYCERERPIKEVVNGVPLCRSCYTIVSRDKNKRREEPKEIEKKKCAFCNKQRGINEYRKSKTVLKDICEHCINNIGLKQLQQEIKQSQRIARIRLMRQLLANGTKAQQEMAQQFFDNVKKAYYTVGNKEKIKESIKQFRAKYPEKVEAWNAILRFPKHKGIHLHHWSYNQLHHEDIIALRAQDHRKIHNYIDYDPETKMYKEKRSGLLLNTKSLHAAFISLVLEHY